MPATKCFRNQRGIDKTVASKRIRHQMVLSIKVFRHQSGLVIKVLHAYNWFMHQMVKRFSGLGINYFLVIKAGKVIQGIGI